MIVTTTMSIAVFFGFVGLAMADPGRDLCKVYNGGLKCSKMISNLFPYDAFLSFNDDVDRFTEEMKFLEIDNSNITTLQSRSFQRMPFLSQLLLRKIELVEIEQGAFDGLQRLKLVDLSLNLIRQIPPEAFKYTKINRLNLAGNRQLEMPENEPFLHARYLTSLSLKSCNLQRVPGSAFADVPSLVHLDLSQNRLTSLPDEVFSRLKHIAFLDLAGNRFVNLNFKVLESVPAFPKYPTSVLLADNPWTCNCTLKRLSDWVTQNSKTETWNSDPSATRLRKLVKCSEPMGLSWNSVSFRKLMNSC